MQLCTLLQQHVYSSSIIITIKINTAVHSCKINTIARCKFIFINFLFFLLLAGFFSMCTPANSLSLFLLIFQSLQGVLSYFLQSRAPCSLAPHSQHFAFACAKNSTLVSSSASFFGDLFLSFFLNSLAIL